MFFTTGLFWMLMGVLLVVIGAGFKILADDRGWVVSWWKWLLALLWYAVFSLSFYAFGTLAGENEAAAGFRVLIMGMFISLILGVGLWRLVAMKPKPELAEGQD
jgi:type VI protein secretion system component VasK